MLLSVVVVVALLLLWYLEDDMLSGLLADDTVLFELLALNPRSIGGAAGVFVALLEVLVRKALGSGILICRQP